MKPARFRANGVLRLLALACMLAGAGCVDLIGRISGAYTGPQPEQVPLTNEVAVIRVVRPHDAQLVLIVDRVRFANDAHNVNRVVKVWITPENQDAVAALNLAVGDRIVVSTAFSGIDETGGSLNTPDWPGHNAMEYPIGSHRIIQIARAAR